MNDHEKQTIAAFIQKEKRHRYEYLLGSPDKRRDCYKGLPHRLNHCADLDPRYVRWLPSNTDIAALLRKEGCPRSVYIISSESEIDGRTLPLDEALDLVSDYGWGTIVSCIPGVLAYYYDEDGLRRALLKKGS